MSKLFWRRRNKLALPPLHRHPAVGCQCDEGVKGLGVLSKASIFFTDPEIGGAVDEQVIYSARMTKKVDMLVPAKACEYFVPTGRLIRFRQHGFYLGAPLRSRIAPVPIDALVRE